MDLSVIKRLQKKINVTGLFQKIRCRSRTFPEKIGQIILPFIHDALTHTDGLSKKSLITELNFSKK
jgi:hypothetical protein